MQVLRTLGAPLQPPERYTASPKNIFNFSVAHPECPKCQYRHLLGTPTSEAGSQGSRKSARSTLEGNDAQEYYMYMCTLRGPWEIAKTTHVKPKRPNRG